MYFIHSRPMLNFHFLATWVYFQSIFIIFSACLCLLLVYFVYISCHYNFHLTHLFSSLTYFVGHHLVVSSSLDSHYLFILLLLYLFCSLFLCFIMLHVFSLPPFPTPIKLYDSTILPLVCFLY